MSGPSRRGPTRSDDLARWERRVNDQAARFERGESPEALTRHVRGLLGDIPSAVRFMRDPEAGDAVMRQAAARELAERDASPETHDDPAVADVVRQDEQDLRGRYARWRETDQLAGAAGQEPDEDELAARASGADLSALARTEAVAAQYAAARTPTWHDDQNANTAMAMSVAADTTMRGAPPGAATVSAAYRTQAARQTTNARLREVTGQVEDYADRQAAVEPRYADRRDYPRHDGPQVGGPVVGA